jgi:hypothetical protein
MLLASNEQHRKSNGGRGIRTPKSLRTPVFKTGAIAILPALLENGESSYRQPAPTNNTKRTRPPAYGFFVFVFVAGDGFGFTVNCLPGARVSPVSGADGLAAGMESGITVPRDSTRTA